VLDLATASPATLQTSAFATTIEPVGLVNVTPDANGQLVIGKTTSAVYNQLDNKLYRWDDDINKYRRKALAGDFEANSVTAGVLAVDAVTAGTIAAAAISTRELTTSELLVGKGGGKPGKIRVVDSLGNTSAFIGVGDDNTSFNYFRDIRIGPDLNNPTLYASQTGVTIQGATFTLQLNNIATAINNGYISGYMTGYAGLRVRQTSGTAYESAVLAGSIGCYDPSLGGSAYMVAGGGAYATVGVANYAGSVEMSFAGGYSRLWINGNPVVMSRRTGWAAATGNATRTTFATSTVTLPLLAERVKALIDDLTTHGLIGS